MPFVHTSLSTPASLAAFSPAAPLAVVPLDAVAAEDLILGARKLDAWIRSLSGDTLGLEAVQAVIAPCPVLGNSTALHDAVLGIVSFQRLSSPTPRQWSGLALDLIGLYPGEWAARRMALRTALLLARQHYDGDADANADADVERPVDALFASLSTHLETASPGDIESFLDEAEQRLPRLLADAGTLGKKLAADFAAALDGLHRNAYGLPPADGKSGPPPLRYDPKKIVATPWKELYLFSKTPAALSAASTKTHFIASAGPDALARAAKNLRALSRRIPKQIAAQADVDTLDTLDIPGAPDTLGALLRKLRHDAALWRAGKETSNRPAIPNSYGFTDAARPEGTMTALRRQAPAKCAPNAGKNGARTRTDGGIGLALGDLVLAHTDFTLPGAVPFSWTRVYNSRLAAFDRGPLGARWINAWTVRIDIGRNCLIYRGADGRSHPCPPLPPGRLYRDPIEEFTLAASGNRLITLAHRSARPAGFDLDTPCTQTFERVGGTRDAPEHYRLVMLRTNSGLTAGLHYGYVAEGREFLSEIVVRQDETLLYRLSTKIDGNGRIREIRLIRANLPERRLVTYFYIPNNDGSGDLFLAQDENATHRAYRYRSHLIDRHADRNGYSTGFEWDGDDATARAVREWKDGIAGELRIEWDKHIRHTLVTDALGYRTGYFHDRHGYTCRIVHPDACEEWFFRDARKNLLRHHRPDGSIDACARDERGNPVSHTRPDGSRVWFEYGDEDRLTGIQDAMGGVWRFTYDRRGNRTEQTDPLGHTTRCAYNALNLPVEIVDADGGTTTFAYTAPGLLQRRTDRAGNAETWEYDDRGRVKSHTDAAGATTRYLYTCHTECDPESPAAANYPRTESERRRIDRERQNSGQLEWIVRPDQSRERFLHDAEGQLIEYTAPLGRKTEWNYSPAGLPLRRRDPADRAVEYRWDPLGRLAAIVNENGAEAWFRYDATGRLRERSDFDGQTVRYGYGTGSPLPREIESGDIRHLLSLDPMGRILERRGQCRAPDGSWRDAERDAFAWDANGRLVLAENAASRLTWNYDRTGNLTAECQHYRLDGTNGTNGTNGTDGADHSGGPGFAAVWKYRYDPLGNRIAVLRPDGYRLDILPDAEGNALRITLDDAEIASFERDGLGREIERRLGNGLACRQTFTLEGKLEEQILFAHAAFSEFPGGSTTRRTAKSATENMVEDTEEIAVETVPDAPSGITGWLRKRKYRYDLAGHLVRIEDSGKGHRDYRYDPSGRLIDATGPLGHEHFAFDPAGNPLGSGTPRRRHNQAAPDNLLAEFAGNRYRYDRRGNLTEKTRNGGSTRYRWNTFDQLTGIDTGTARIDFIYDPLGRRIAKRVAFVSNAPRPCEKNGREQPAPDRNPTLILYGWDGDRLAWESGEHGSAHYFYEPGTFVPLLMTLRDYPLPLPPIPERAAANPNVNGAPRRNDPSGTASIPALLPVPTPRAAPFSTALPISSARYFWIHCDRNGAPQEMTDAEGRIAWSAHYRAWGRADENTESETPEKESRQKNAPKRCPGNPLRFQGQYHDPETGLHCHRHRYYDPETGRFLSKNPAGPTGELNPYRYAPNPLEWINPLGLTWENMEPATETSLPLSVFFPISAPISASISAPISTPIPANAPAKRRRKRTAPSPPSPSTPPIFPTPPFPASPPPAPSPYAILREYRRTFETVLAHEIPACGHERAARQISPTCQL